MRVQSSGPTRLLRMRSHATFASVHSRRMPISWRDISSENIATGCRPIATLRGDVEGERRLPDAGSRRDDDQVARLQPRREDVEVAESGRQTRIGGLAVLDRLQVDHRLVDEVAKDRHVFLILAARDVVDALLGFVGNRLGILGRRVRHVHDVRRAEISRRSNAVCDTILA